MHQRSRECLAAYRDVPDLNMTVDTYLLDFTVGEAAFVDMESRHNVINTVERILQEYLKDLQRQSIMDIDGGFLVLLVGPDGVLISIRGYKEGILTINIEAFHADANQPLLTVEKIRAVEVAIAKALQVVRSKYLPPIKRGGTVDIYLTTSDERILEYDVDKTLFEEQSPYQKVQVVHSRSLGNLLILDDLQNMSEKDLIYTETLMQRGVENYEGKEIVILGGGDGCLLYELLKENPKFVTMLELDEVVMKACAKYLRSACGTCLDCYNADNYTIVVGDCFITLQKLIDEGKKVDYVFGDLTDIPVDSSGEQETWDFIRTIINKSIQVLKPGGKYMTHGNGSSVPKSLVAFETMLTKLITPVEFTKSKAFVPSFLEEWVFYHITPQFKPESR